MIDKKIKEYRLRAKKVLDEEYGSHAVGPNGEDWGERYYLHEITTTALMIQLEDLFNRRISIPEGIKNG